MSGQVQISEVELSTTAEVKSSNGNDKDMPTKARKKSSESDAAVEWVQSQLSDFSDSRDAYDAHKSAFKVTLFTGLIAFLLLVYILVNYFHVVEQRTIGSISSSSGWG